MHPIEMEAHVLAEDPRFCEYLDAHHSLDSRWPHSTGTAARWLREQCDVDTLGRISTDPEAAAAFDQIVKRFRLWERNEELEV
ncbi:hypothetical protein [Modicisalibacter coralii]|uniref:hypothetical protein n=1 Tax=Modicisalibacter coralii TaxID=2304602 RepID=UPI00100C0934|nr:hypothetical protein [Halomonas coralii]